MWSWCWAMRRGHSEEAWSVGTIAAMYRERAVNQGQFSRCWQGRARSTVASTMLMTLVDVPLVSRTVRAVLTGIGQPMRPSSGPCAAHCMGIPC